MKNMVLVASGLGDTKNIGDYVQSVAQEQYWHHTDGFIDRETLNQVQYSEQVNLIMNSWYMFKPQNFPPASCINPLFVSIHINPYISKDFFRKETIDYLKRFEPIGARDTGTQKLLEKHGIKSYFSACLTLTLGIKYKTTIKNNEIVFVDPYTIPFGGWNVKIETIIKSLFYLAAHPVNAHRLTKKVDYTFTRLAALSCYLDRLLGMANFYHTYSQVFDDELIFSAVFKTHIISNKGVSEEEKMEMARNLISFYAGAKLVITSRIHAALPCLGVETPVIFVSYKNHDLHKESADRFIGLEQFFHLIRWDNNKLTVVSEYLRNIRKMKKIGREIEIRNSSSYIPYRDKLIETTSQFVNRCEGGGKNCEFVTYETNGSIKRT